MLLEKISEVIREELNLSDMEITEETSFKEDLGADSLDLLELVMAMEEEYDIEIPTEKLETMLTVGDVLDYLREQGVED